MEQLLIFSENVGTKLDELIAELTPTEVVILADENTACLCLPLLCEQSKTAANAQRIVIPSGDEHKDISSLQLVWKSLSDMSVKRSALLVNLGGGMVCDLGGFAAATFKRGIRFVNIPTTLLAAVDASVGGKTGINFNELKNEVGAFAEPAASIISTIFFDSLSESEMLSGYGEMLKHGLLCGKPYLRTLLDGEARSVTLEMLEKSVRYKSSVVEQDFKEAGLRRALNFGHTAGHALEALAMHRGKPMPHGHAVAHGCVVALVLSRLMLNFPSQKLYSFAEYVRERYPLPEITCDDYPELLSLMSHDKKNLMDNRVNFTLLSQIGDIRIDCMVADEEIRNALDIYRDLMGI